MKFVTSNGLIRLWNNILAKLKAIFIEYDNTNSNLEATTVQGAIDELSSKTDRMGNCYFKYENGVYYVGHEEG